MALLEGYKPVLATLPVFEVGKYYPPRQIQVETSKSNSNPSPPPTELLIFAPNTAGTYPVILFFHGTCIRNIYYSDLLNFISSHGYVIVAPQIYTYVPPLGSVEVDDAADVVKWLPIGLQSKLPTDVEGDLSKLALAGHSRGGQTAFALALGYYTNKDVDRNIFSALIGIDPVGGLSRCCQSSPPVLNGHSFNLSIPVTVIGTGLGGEGKNCLMKRPCAPKNMNHEKFYNQCKPPCGHFVTTDYGHMDMLNDHLPGMVGPMLVCMCKKGTGPKDPMRRCVGGIVVASLKAYFARDREDLMTTAQDPYVAPVKLDPHEFIFEA